MASQEIQKSIKGTASTLAKTVVGEAAEEGPYMFECLTCSLIQVKFPSSIIIQISEETSLLGTVRVAQIGASWKQREEMGGQTPTRAKNSVFALIKAKKGPNRAQDGPFLLKYCLRNIALGRYNSV